VDGQKKSLCIVGDSLTTRIHTIYISNLLMIVDKLNMKIRRRLSAVVLYSMECVDCACVDDVDIYNDQTRHSDTVLDLFD
jgi:uncharacterized protein (UPF0218 family)